MAQLALGQIRDEKPSGIHDEWDVHFSPDLAENISNDGVQEELTEFVLDRRNCFALETLVVAGVFVLPKVPNEWIFDLPDEARLF